MRLPCVGCTPELHVEIKRKLVGCRADADRVELGLALVFDIGLQQVGGEHVATQQEFVILL